ncbi:hypothetical protein [Nonomuraea diastatica]|uniref:hypothetical protein n=1 Tax=Nonomuraea diastatica TaxID=1848329 RepID=UPI00140CAB31|nr:hypothetical protein [Nonomuraea diastatica]
MWAARWAWRCPARRRHGRHRDHAAAGGRVIAAALVAGTMLPKQAREDAGDAVR